GPARARRSGRPRRSRRRPGRRTGRVGKVDGEPRLPRRRVRVRRRRFRRARGCAGPAGTQPLLLRQARLAPARAFPRAVPGADEPGSRRRREGDRRDAERPGGGGYIRLSLALGARAANRRRCRYSRRARSRRGGARGARAEHDLPAAPARSARVSADGGARRERAVLLARARYDARGDPRGDHGTLGEPVTASPRLISVLIGAYNAAPYLAEAIESVFAQSHRPLELIVVD